MNKTLNDVKVGQTVKVKKIAHKNQISRRLIEMGITKSENIFVRKVAPLGDPIEINIRGYELTIRKEEAENIIVE